MGIDTDRGPTWYDLLGLDRDAGTQEIRDAWRLATDRATPGSSRFRSYNQAAETLLDPERRAAYDASLPPEGDEPAPVVPPGPADPRPAAPVPAAPATDEDTDPQDPADAAEDAAYAPYARRVGGALVDAMLGVVGVLPLLAVVVLAGPSGLLSRPPGTVLLAAATAVAVGAALWNLVWRQGRTGRTVGKSVAGTRVVVAGDPDPAGIGIGRAAARLLLRVLDSVPLLLGYLWPLWDRRRRTFSDMLARTVVVRDTEPGTGAGRRRLSTRLLVAMAVVAAAALALGIVAVRNAQAPAPPFGEADQARVAAEDAAVAILSYDYEQLPQDRARAERYLTGDFRDSYLENFALLQEQPDGSEGPAVQSQAVVTAQVMSSGVVELTPEGDRARVLVFVNQTSERQGAEPQVFQNRVAMTMDRVGDRWLVADLRSY